MASSPSASVPAAGVLSGRRACGPPVIRIRLLGRFAVERDGEEIAQGSFGGRLARRLLRLLALRRESLVPKDLIADALWPDNPPADPAGNIEVLVSRIRSALGDRSLIRTGPGGYVLTDTGRCHVDAEEFLAAVRAGRDAPRGRPEEALTCFRAALEIWRGEPLPEDTYADWAQADRRQLSMAYLEALDGAATAALDALDSLNSVDSLDEPRASAATAADAASWARRALTAEPLRESSVLLLVRALTAAGDQAGALAAFEEYRDRLTTETGLEPTSRARDLHQRVLADQGRLACLTRSAPGHENVFLGRERELAVLADAAAGRGPRCVLLTGPSGIGKTALLTEAARRAAMPVLVTQAFAPDQDEAWSLAGRLLGRAARRLGAPLAAVLTEPEASALAEVMPGLAAPPGTAGELDGETRRALALQGAVRLLAAVAGPRCLVVADDLQWADPASVTLLGLLVRRLDCVSLAAAYRSDAGSGADPAEALGIPASLLADITLGTLPTRVIRDLFSDQALAESIIRQADTPFTVTEVIAALARRGAITRDDDGKWRARAGHDAAGAAAIVAAGIRQAAGNRLSGLPSRWRDMLGLLALLGRPAPSPLLAAASGTGLHAALDTLEGLASAELASPGPRGWALSHDLVRHAATGAMTPAEAARRHALLAQALRRHDADPAEIARHLAASGDNGGAAMTYATAARRQLERNRDREAMGLAGTGLSLDPGGGTRAALLEARGEARRRVGQLAGARADFTASLDSLDAPGSRSRVLAKLAILDARTADTARGAELAALAIAEAGDQPAALGQALAAGAIIDLTQGNLTRARDRIRRAARLLDQAGDSCGGVRLLYWRALASFLEGRPRDAAAQFDRLARLEMAPGEILRLWSPRATRGHALVFLGQAADGLAEIDQSLGRARAACRPATEAECLCRRAEALAALGQGDGATEAAERAADVAGSIGHAEWTAAAHRGLGIACEASGRPDRAEAAYRDSLRAAERLPVYRAWAAGRLGALLARQGRPGEAAPYVRAAMTEGTPLTRHEARWARAELLASRGDDEACREAAAAALHQARDDDYLILEPRLRELAGQ